MVLFCASTYQQCIIPLNDLFNAKLGLYNLFSTFYNLFNLFSLANAIKPGSVKKINESNMAFKKVCNNNGKWQLLNPGGLRATGC
jgi:hypothetical protein